MSQAEDLLNSLSETVTHHKHPVPDSDTYFLIDPYTRQIENTNYQKTVLMQGDHNSERFTFELPRYVDGHDMSLCNRVIVHFDNVGDNINDIHSDVAYTDDLRLNPDKPDTVICSWLIRREATQIVGLLSFSLQYLCVEDDETISYEWNTDSYDFIEIRKSKKNGEAAIIQYTNVLEQWRSQIFGAGDSVMANITAEGESQVTAVQNESVSQQAAIRLKGSETLATIPDDYTDVYNMASEALRSKADSVICDAEGDVITIPDSSNDYVRGLNVYGKSTQFTTTGKNKLSVVSPSRTYNGITYTVREDGSVHVVGTATAASWLCPGGYTSDSDKLIRLPAGEYFISGNPNSTVTGYINGYYSDGTAIAQINDAGTGGRTFTLNQEAHIYYQIMVGTGATVDTVLYPQIEVGTIATDFEPYTGGKSAPNPDHPQALASVEKPTVHIYGKNMFDTVAFVDNAAANGKGHVVQLTEHGISVQTASYLEDYTKYDFGFAQNTHYTISFDSVWESSSNDTTQFSVLICYTDGSKDNIQISYADGDTSYHCISALNKSVACVAVGTWRHSGVCKLQNINLVKGYYTSGTMPGYEQCVHQQVRFNHTLLGIPVTLNGNYVDANDQQWMCDEVDFERAVHIQRISTIELTGSEYILKSGEKWQKDGMYSTYAAPLTSSSQYGIDIPDAMPWCFSTHARPNGWEWSYYDCLDNVGVRKNIFHLSFNNSTIGITDEDTDENKLAKFKAYLTEQYNAGTPVTIWYPLATPIETPLPAEEIEVYKSLKTNYPNTTVINDASAMMKIKYNADTKIYIAEMADSRADSLMEEVLNGTY